MMADGPPRRPACVGHVWHLGLVVLVTASPPAAAQTGATRVQDSAGVVIMTSTGDDRVAPWVLTPVRRIGGADTGVLAFPPLGREHVAVDGRGLIHVLDTLRKHVVVLDTTGRVVRVIGAPGTGPGQLRLPETLMVWGDGTVEIKDPVRTALIRFGPDGQFVAELALPRDRTRYPQGRVHRLGDTAFVVVVGYESEHWQYRLLMETPTDTGLTAELTVPSRGLRRVQCASFARPTYFSPELVLGAGDGLVAVNSQPEYVINLFQAGRLTSSVRRSTALDPGGSPALAQRYPEGFRIALPEGRGCTVDVEVLAAEFGVEASLPSVAAIGIDRAGRLWVERYSASRANRRVDVFERGSYVGTLPIPLPYGFVGDLAIVPSKPESRGGLDVLRSTP